MLEELKWFGSLIGALSLYMHYSRTNCITYISLNCDLMEATCHGWNPRRAKYRKYNQIVDILTKLCLLSTECRYAFNILADFNISHNVHTYIDHCYAFVAEVNFNLTLLLDSIACLSGFDLQVSIRRNYSIFKIS